MHLSKKGKGYRRMWRQSERQPAAKKRILRSECRRCKRDEKLKTPCQKSFEDFVKKRDLKYNTEPEKNDECVHQDPKPLSLCAACKREDEIARPNPVAYKRLQEERAAATPFGRKVCCLSVVEKEVSGLLDDPNKFKDYLPAKEA
ncbi:hypothetical protein AVEN_136314-1 [Araneus ventricosus]|uniref:Uncharacterized protein n=1 Tax=Araneus ventricosus TaxID=182803 RepID=A0A4Y2PIW3_ARAVE|nr:hypothetical protein AVEN_136314-1 [Araneus ventricosus]